MSYDTKASILGAASCAPLSRKRVQEDIDDKGHPFSNQEVKPISLWQNIFAEHKVTHIVDFTPGSGALAIAASGAMEYEGIAANDAHRDWLDTIVDRGVMYKAGHEEGYAQKLGGDEGFLEKASKYFGGVMMEARRMLEPVAEDGDDEEESDEEEEEAVA